MKTKGGKGFLSKAEKLDIRSSRLKEGRIAKKYHITVATVLRIKAMDFTLLVK